MNRRVVAVIDWRAAAPLKENVRFFRRASDNGKVLVADGPAGAAKHRSLTLREDGTCELHGFSTAAVARRLGWSSVRKKARKVRMDQRG